MKNYVDFINDCLVAAQEKPNEGDSIATEYFSFVNSEAKSADDIVQWLHARGYTISADDGTKIFNQKNLHKTETLSVRAY